MIDADILQKLMESEFGEMKCSRCGRIMVFEKFYGLNENFSGWRCIYCGEIVDQVILKNHFKQRQ